MSNKGGTVLAYKNKPALKKMFVAEVINHRKQDQLIKGTYGKENGKFKGCAVGCGVHTLNMKLGKTYSYDDHSAYEKELGIPEWLARLEDTIFEGLPVKESKLWPEQFAKAIPVGVGFKIVKWQFCAYLMKENIDRVLKLKISDELKEQVVSAIRQILELHEKSIKTGRSAESAAESAESAAESAESAARSAKSAAGSAARSAAWSAAWSAKSAAESAAWSAAWSAE